MFAGLSKTELEELAQVAVPRSYEAGQVIFREGDEGDTTFVIRSGAVKITREHGGRTIALAELRGGDMFGELAMFGSELRSATAQALEDTTAIALLAGDIRRLLEAHPARLEGDELTLEFPPAAKFHREKAELPKNVGLLADALYEVTGKRLSLVFTEGAEREAKTPEHEQPATEEEIVELVKSTFDAREVDD
jgi:CRP-like cAMP-binding protein